MCAQYSSYSALEVDFFIDWPIAYKGTRPHIQLHRDKAVHRVGTKIQLWATKRKLFCSMELGGVLLSLWSQHSLLLYTGIVLPMTKCPGPHSCMGAVPSARCGLERLLPSVPGALFQPREDWLDWEWQGVFSTHLVSNPEFKHRRDLEQIIQTLQTQFLHLQNGVTVETVGLWWDDACKTCWALTPGNHAGKRASVFSVEWLWPCLGEAEGCRSSCDPTGWLPAVLTASLSFYSHGWWRVEPRKESELSTLGGWGQFSIQGTFHRWDQGFRHV